MQTTETLPQEYDYSSWPRDFDFRMNVAEQQEILCHSNNSELKEKIHPQSAAN